MEVLDYIKSHTLNDLLHDNETMNKKFTNNKYSEYISTDEKLMDMISIIIMHNNNPNYGFLPITITDITNITNGEGSKTAIINTEEYGSIPAEYPDDIDYKAAGNYIVCNNNMYKILSVFPNNDDNITEVFAEEVIVDFNINTLDDFSNILSICIGNMIKSYLNEN